MQTCIEIQAASVALYSRRCALCIARTRMLIKPIVKNHKEMFLFDVWKRVYCRVCFSLGLGLLLVASLSKWLGS